MPINSPIPNQQTKQLNQNFSLDISTIYSDFVEEIDATRSIVNIQVDYSALNNLQVSTLAGLQQLLHPQSTPQESRVSAFYRLIGLPVISSQYQFFNPGLDTIPGTKMVPLSQKLTITNSPISGFKTISSLRENYFYYIGSNFSSGIFNITSSALALTSSTNVRNFNVPTATSVDPFDMAPADQSYTPSLATIIGKNNQVTLAQYVDGLGNTPSTLAGGGTIGSTRYHFIKPLIVDGRIDFSVNPASRKVGVPFVPTKQNLLVSENTFVKRPLIEKVVRDRVGQNQGAVTSPSQQQLIQYILNVPTVQNDSVIQSALNQINATASTQPAFQEYLFIIQAMCVKLVEAQLKIQIVQGRYYWLPVPSANGPEGGVTSYPPIISQSLPNGTNNSFITTRDQDIINMTLIQQASSYFSAQTAALNAQPSPGPFAFDSFQTFAPDTTSGYGNNAASELETLTKSREHDMSVAGDALQTIEIIMGEWSGLGLCDIIAVMGALYIMPQASLLGLLDPDAYARMVTTLNLQSNQPSQNSISQAQMDLVSSLQDMYNLEQDIYQNIALNPGKYGLKT